MITARSLPVLLSLAVHASLGVVALTSRHRVAAAPIPASGAIEVSIFSALPAEPEQRTPTEPAAEPHAEPHAIDPRPPSAAIKANPATPVGPQSVADSSPPSGVEATPASLEPVAFHFALGSVPAQLVTASANAGRVAMPSAAAPSGAASAPVSESAVSIRAALIAGSPPSYTAAAAAAGIEAELAFEIIVDRAGSVQSARPLAHVGYGLDETAALAIRQYRFSPAQQARQPVAVRMRWVVRFQLR